MTSPHLSSPLHRLGCTLSPVGNGVVLPLPPCQVTVRLRVVGFTGVAFEELNSTGLKRRIHRVYVFSFQGQASPHWRLLHLTYVEVRQGQATLETTLGYSFFFKVKRRLHSDLRLRRLRFVFYTTSPPRMKKRGYASPVVQASPQMQKRDYGKATHATSPPRMRSEATRHL